LRGIAAASPAAAATFGNFPTLFLGLVASDGTWEHYDGRIRITAAYGNKVADGLDPSRYYEYLGEKAESWSYLKSSFYRPLGYPEGIYRVGPLARLNLCDRMGTPLADRELVEFREHGEGVVCSSFLFHYARLIEILASIERIEAMLDDPDLRSDDLRADASLNQREGVGCSEAPRGTLFHHYGVSEHGLIEKANLLIATGQNNLAMNRAVLQIARHYIRGLHIPEGVLNRLEAGIRAFDPCLSCSTHAVGQMPLRLQLLGPDGTLVAEVQRD
jgi:NAD-reducing hydrogenase large subunit